MDLKNFLTLRLPEDVGYYYEGKDGDLMYRIGMFSKLAKVTIKTLHHYDEVGLLTPAYVDEENGYRYYTTDQLVRLGEIVALRQMGFSIPETIAIVDGHNIAGILEQRRAELEHDVQSVTDQLLNHAGAR